MKYTPQRSGLAEFLKGPEVRRVLTEEANRRMARMRALAPKQTGETAASGHLEYGKGVKGDRIVVRIVFEGAAVEQQFGNRRTRATFFMTRALEGD